MKEILEILSRADMTERARATAVRIFTILADAEAAAHGVDRSRVHFHEVGAVDSIVDIVTAAVCLDDLDVTEVIVPYLCEGNGMVRCQHGLIPIPVPAVVNIAQAHGLTLKPTDIQGLPSGPLTGCRSALPLKGSAWARENGSTSGPASCGPC